MTKHTPGPWTRDPCERNWVVSGDTWIATIRDGEEGDGDLIIAAPDLLEALKGFVACDFESVPPSALVRAVCVCQDEARAAIAKAIGGRAGLRMEGK